MSVERILEKVRKMLAIANNEAASEAERNTALKIAHDLLAKNELDMSDVAASERDKEDPRGQWSGDGWNATWARVIRNSMSRLFRCYYYTGERINNTRSNHHFVGRESAATTAMYMSDWIIKTVLKKSDKQYKHRLTPEGRSFCIGVSHRLWTRVQELIKAKQQEFTQSGVALVLYDVAQKEEALNLDFLAKLGVIFEKERKARSQTVREKAFANGQNHANGIQLVTQINHKKRGELS